MTDDEIKKRIIALQSKADTAHEKLLNSYQRDIVSSYKKSLEEIKKKIAGIYEKFGDNVTYSDMQSYNRLAVLEKEISLQLKELTGENIKLTTESIKECFAESYYRTGYSFESGLGIKVGFGQLNPTVISAVVLNSLDSIKWPNRIKDHIANKYNNAIRQEITQGLIEGKGYAKIAQAITKRTEITASRALIIARTESGRAQSTGRVLAYSKAEVAAERLGIKTTRIWVSTLDQRTRDTHRSMDMQEAHENADGKLVFTLPGGAETEGPRLSGIAAEDINCFPYYISVNSLSSVENLTKRYYEGELIKIITASGIQITGTPNHPILTPQGWIPLNSLNKGSDIFCARFSDKMVTRNPNVDYTPAIFRDIFDFANIISPAKRFTGVKKNFHGDGFESDVYIISTKSFLKFALQTIFSKPFSKKNFFFSQFRKSSFFRKRFFIKFFFAGWLTFSCLIRFCDKFFTICKTCFGHSQKHSFASIQGDDLIFSKNSQNYIPTDAEFVSESLNRKSFFIKLDNIVSVDRIIFSGHVYNLETVDNYYLVNNIKENNYNGNCIIAHNCRCTSRMEIKGITHKVRRDGEGSLVKNMSFDEWAAEKGIRLRKTVRGDDIGFNKYKRFNDSEFGSLANLKLTEDEASAIKYYTSDDRKINALNKKLREGTATKNDKIVEKVLNQALNKMPSYEGTVYRGIKISDVDGFIKRYTSGKEIDFSQFTSTSFKKAESYYGNVKYEIISKTGKDVSALSSKPAEKEVLFKSDAKFKVINVENKNGKTYIILEEK